MSLIHRYQSNGYNIVLDINSGCIHLVDLVTYEVLPFMEEGLSEQEIVDRLKDQYPEADIRTSVSECEKLKEQGMLFTRDVYENIIEEFTENRQTVVKALCLHIAHDCNLACRYCFAEEGEYHGRRALMSFEVGKKALDFLIANSGSRKNLEVDFFGGEPLMNWQVVKDLVAYGREQEKLHNKKFRFTLTTNGVLLNDEVMEFCNKEMGNVVLSVDGRKEVHDYMRPFRKGAGSYDLIIPKFQKFAESRNQDKYYVRGTFTHHNLDFSKDVLHLADLGFKQISVEPVVAADTEEYAIREEDIPQIKEEYDALAKEMIAREKAMAAMNGAEGLFLVNTGMQGVAVTATTKAFARAGIGAPPLRRNEAALVDVAEFTVGDAFKALGLRGAYGYFEQNESSDQFRIDGMLGLDFVGRGRLTIDYPERKLYFAAPPAEAAAAPAAAAPAKGK